ncbi:MAG: hypothetical protein Q8N23_35500 [Archangium sp.]|nr:hypothetical protein [Archangium sp.]MDP3158031.1 hypothetical protein [Archangium sp.]MDP3570563.1 hypothetical protein [Archangium sp.]
MMKKTLSIAVLALAGCATVQLPADRLQGSEASIRSAEELGASNVPAARLHLQLAKDETLAAKKLAADGDDRAELVLARAEADAELALGLARQVAVHSEALRAEEDLKAVRARPTN